LRSPQKLGLPQHIVDSPFPFLYDIFYQFKSFDILDDEIRLMHGRLRIAVAKLSLQKEKTAK